MGGLGLRDPLSNYAHLQMTSNPIGNIHQMSQRIENGWRQSTGSE